MVELPEPALLPDPGTCGGWRRLRARSAESAASFLREAAFLRARDRFGESASRADDLAQSVCWRADPALGGAIRRAGEETPLEAWIDGVLENLRKEEWKEGRGRREARQAKVVEERDPGAATPAGRPGLRRADEKRLTPKQAAAWRRWKEHPRLWYVSRSLRISRGAARDRLRAVSRKLLGGTPPTDPRPSDRSWASDMLECRRNALSPEQREFLRLCARGARPATVARRLSIPIDSVKRRMKYWRKKALRT